MSFSENKVIADRLLLRGNYPDSIRAYVASILEQPEYADLLGFNLALARRRWRSERSGKAPTVAVCGWELSHNAAGRVRSLADIWREITSTEIIGASFEHWSDTLWAPLGNMDIPCHRIHVSDDRQFLRNALELVLAHPYDLVHLSKPRMPNILFGLLYKIIWDAKVIVDIDDEELGAFKEARPRSLEAMIEGQGGTLRWDKLAHAEWTGVAVGYTSHFDAVTVSNAALQDQYGGVVVPHARPASWFNVTDERRKQIRAAHGIEPDKTVVLFFGTPRRHKGLLETAQAIAAMGREDLCFLIVGDFPDEKLKTALEEVGGLDIRFLPDQPYELIPEITQLGDICVLLQSETSLMARYQVPAKLTDALAAGILVLLQPTPATMEFVERGVVIPTSADLLTQTLRRALADPMAADCVRENGKKHFRTNLSVEACVPTLTAFLENQTPLPNPRLLLESPRQKQLFDVLGGWGGVLTSAGQGRQNSQTETEYTQKVPAQIVVYSVLIGDYEDIKEPAVLDPAVRYILFTDNPKLKADRWEVIPIDTLGLSPRKASRLPKLLPHRYLPDHDVSVYLDASLEIVEPNVREMVSQSLLEADIAAYPHFQRDCIFAEIDECISKDKVDAIAAHSLIGRLKAEGFPAEHGLLENAFLIRRDTPKMRRLNDAWHKEFQKGPGRDQFHLMYLLWKHQIKWRRLDNAAQFRKSPHVRFKAHTGAPDPALNVDGMKARINWVIGGPSSKGWAYENNARRLMSRMPEFDHVVNDPEPSDCAVYFDTLIHQEYPKPAQHSILRLGGPNPVRRRFGNDPEAIAEGLSVFDAIIPLSQELTEMAELSSATLFPIPNGLNLKRFRPGSSNSEHRDFTVGFAGNCVSRMEREFKGLDLLEVASKRAGVILKTLQKGENQIPHERMVEDFYSQIDCLVHPVGTGKEGCSNVVMEALSCGVPVITTRECGFHGAMLTDGANVLFCERSTENIAAQIIRLKSNPGFARRLGLSGAKFARVHHDIDTVAHKFRRAVVETLNDGADFKRVRPRLRIAMISTTFWPKFAGMEMMVHNLATALQRMGNDAVLFTRSVVGDYVEIEHEYDLIRVPMEQTELRQMFAKKHREAPFDAIYVQGAYAAATLAHELKEEFGLPLILRTHGEDIQIEDEIGYGLRLNPKKAAVIRENMRKADLNVSISRHVLKQARPLAPASDHRVISNGVDADHFDRPRNKKLHERFSLPPETAVLLTVGRNIAAKSFPLAIEALAKVRRLHPDAVLVHVGKEGNGDDLTEVAAKHGVSDAFFQYGEANYFDMPDIYASADIFVFPSRLETFGNVTVEAMAAGLPCVEFDYGANADKIVRGKTGFILPYGDVEGMAQAITSLLGSAEKRMEFSAEGKRHVRRRFDWRAIARQYHSCFLDYSLQKAAPARQMRLAFAADKMVRNKGGGGEKSLTSLVNAMVMRGHEVFLIIKEPGVESHESAFYSLHPDVRLCNILGWENGETVASEQRRDLLLKDKIRQIDPDVVVGFFLPEFGFIARGVEGLDVPLVLSHRNDPKEKLQNVAERYPNRLAHIEFANRRAQMLTVQMQTYVELLPEFARSKAVVIPNSVHPVPDALRAKPDVPAVRNIILNVARLASAKNQELMIRSFARIAEEFTDWDIHIYGDGPLRADVERLIDRYNLGERVLLKGTTQNIMPAYRNAKIFAFPSLYEGFSRALSEAMMHGLPTVAIEDCICSRTFIQESGGGIVTPDDEILYSDALSDLIREPSQRLKLGTKARRYISQFTPAHVDAVWESHIREACNLRPVLEAPGGGKRA
ncbi:glycosyltransferase [Pararhodobacter sp.]|uniref:glycosyltransferase n=1 Tax=Pararhodobacter sp. TaxID=2127056 RepID=UPI002FDD18CF